MTEPLHELLELRRLSLEPVTQHLVERLHHLLDLAEVLRLQLLHGARHVLEVRLGDLLLQLLHQLLESMGRAFVHELVIVELADGATHVLRQAIELLQLLLGDLLQDALRALRRLLQALVDALSLATGDLAQSLADVAEDVVEVVSLQLLQRLRAELSEHLLEARKFAALPVAPAAAHQAVQSVVEVATLEQVFGQAIEQVLGIAAERFLRTIPALVPVRPGNHLAGVDGRPVELRLVDPLAQVEPLENELHPRGGQRRSLVQPEALQRLLHARKLAQHGGVALGGLQLGHLKGKSRVEALHQLVELGGLEMAPEDVEHRRLDDLFQHRLVVALFPGLHLELAGARRNDGGQVGDARHGLGLAGPQRAARGVRREILVIGDRDPHADPGALVDFWAAPRQLRHLGNDLLHEVGHGNRELPVLEIGALLLHDPDFVVDVARVVRPDLRPETVLQRRDDAAAVGVVLRVGAGDDDDVDREAEFEAADLHVALFYQVQQTNLDAFRQVRELVDGKDAAVGARHQAVVDGQLIGQVLALRDPDRVDLADQVGDRGVRGGQLFAVSLVGGDPAHRDLVSLRRHAVAAGPTDGRVRIVIDLAALDHGDLLVEQLDQRSDQPALCLAALTEEDDVLAGQDRVLHLGNHRALVADDARKECLAGLDLAHQVLAHLLLHGKHAVLALSQLGNGRGMSQGTTSIWNGDDACPDSTSRAF